MIDIEAIQARIKAIRARADKATAGPWLYRPQDCDDWGVVRFDEFIVAKARNPNALSDTWGAYRNANEDPFRGNGEFIAAARNEIPALCDDVEGLLEEIKALRMAYTGEIAPIERFNDDALVVKRNQPQAVNWKAIAKKQNEIIERILKQNLANKEYSSAKFGSESSEQILFDILFGHITDLSNEAISIYHKALK